MSHKEKQSPDYQGPSKPLSEFETCSLQKWEIMEEVLEMSKSDRPEFKYSFMSIQFPQLHNGHKNSNYYSSIHYWISPVAQW